MQCIAYDMMNLSAKFERNRAIRSDVRDIKEPRGRYKIPSRPANEMNQQCAGWSDKSCGTESAGTVYNASTWKRLS